MKLLLTGAAGFVARHFVDLVRASAPQVEILGVVRPHGGAAAPGPGGVRTIEADLCDGKAVDAVFTEWSPDLVLHLAGQSSVHQSWLDPGGTLRNNVLGVVNLLDAARRKGARPSILVVGSAEEYGAVDPAETPLSEDAPLRPTSPYAVSKVAQGLVAVECGRGAGMRVIRTRTFHHTGPGRGEAFAESSFARQIAEIEAGLRPPVLHVGTSTRSRTSPTCATWCAPTGRCSSEGAPARSTTSAAAGAGASASCSTRSSARRGRGGGAVDPARLRPSDVPVLVGDPAACARPPAGSRASTSPTPWPSCSATGAAGAAAGRRSAVKVLLTGGTGFLGKNVARALARARPRARGPARAAERPSRPAPGSRDRAGDVTDAASLAAAAAGCGAVVHLAGS
jgi:GDP-4-dehydro-6-deoxy-D-mannose reductase